MNSYLYLILLSIVLLTGCGTKAPQDNSAVITSMQIIDRNGFAETFNNKDRISQYQKVDFSSSQPYQKVLRVYGRNAQGQSQSKITSYHENGQPWQYLETVDGRAHGFYREWFPSSQMKIESTLIEGMADINDLAQRSWVFDGKSRVWDEQGRQVAEIHYSKGVLDTPSFYYYPSGKLQKVIPYKSGLIDGDLVVYDEEGAVLEQIPYTADQKQGTARKFWHAQSPPALLYTEKYEDDLLQEGSYHDPQGKLVASIHEGAGLQAVFKEDALYSLISYEKGLPEGLVSLFDPNGALHCTYIIHEGKKHGEEWEYYPSRPSDKPQPKLCVHWNEDKLQGIIKTWYPTGVMESQREISGNKKQGTCFAWYKNSDLLLMEEYENDLLVKGAYFKKGDKAPVSKIDSGKGLATLYTSDGIFIKKVSYEKGTPKLDDDSFR
jgi:antitoxin component YwqK of YwqJK toxin-antitoxin module